MTFPARLSQVQSCILQVRLCQAEHEPRTPAPLFFPVFLPDAALAPTANGRLSPPVSPPIYSQVHPTVYLDKSAVFM